MFSKGPLLPAGACRFGSAVFGEALLVVSPASEHCRWRDSQVLETELSFGPVGSDQKLEMGEHGGYLYEWKT